MADNTNDRVIQSEPDNTNDRVNQKIQSEPEIHDTVTCNVNKMNIQIHSFLLMLFCGLRWHRYSATIPHTRCNIPTW